MKKLFTLLALISIAATTSAQVTTFSLIDGSDDSSWPYGQSWTNLQNGGVWQKNPGAGSWLMFEANTSTYIQGYTITLGSSNKEDGQLPYTWTLFGSNDEGAEKNWTRIHYQAQANNILDDYTAGANINYKPYTFYCNSNVQYKYYKFNITGKAGSGWGCFQISGFNLIPSSVGFSASGYGMDGDTGTKQSGNSFPQTITVTGTGSARISGFQFTTGNDNATYNNRNPKTIKVEGSTDNTNWTTLLSLTNYTGLEDKDYYPYVIDVDGSQDYQYYKFSFDDVSARFFQMSEIAVITALQISTSAHLVNFASLVNNSGFTDLDAELTQDIDMDGVTGWTPIGKTDAEGNGNNGDKAYKGVFNGNGHTIDNLVEDVTTYNNQGLFGVVNGGCIIKNLILGSGCHFYGGKYVGAFVGSSRGSGWVTIENCGNEASVGSEYDKISQNGAAFIGVVVGGGPATRITNCYNTGTIVGASESAVLTGWFGGHGSVEVNNVYNTGSVQGTEGDNLFYRNSTGITFNNVYDITGKQGATSITDAQVKSGELCVTLGSPFTQDLSGDNHPTFSSKAVTAGQWFSNSDDVYYNKEGDDYTVYQLNLNEENTKYAVPDDGTVTAKHVSVARNIPAGQWIGLCLPFDYDIPSGWDVREMTAVNGSGEGASMKFSVAESIVAGKPYIVKPTSNVETITAENKTIAATTTDVSYSDVTMKGSLKKDMIHEGDFYINTSSQIKKLNVSEVALKGFRAYFTVDGGSGVKALSFDIEDDATGIESLTPALFEGDGAIYNIAGQRISKMQKGINIVNGKKVLR